METLPSITEGQDTMHVHKPKPVHGWRELALEIGTIICGIVIALGLEQVIEARH
jgi:hypothetical protein